MFDAKWNKNLFDVLNSMDEKVWAATNPVHMDHTAEGTTITISAPGVNPDDIEVTLADGVLRVAFENEAGVKLGYNKTFDKSWALASGVSEKDLTVTFQFGILCIVLKKEKKPKLKIEVQKVN